MEACKHILNKGAYVLENLLFQTKIIFNMKYEKFQYEFSSLDISSTFYLYSFLMQTS